jgi:hypothetical protein
LNYILSGDGTRAVLGAAVCWDVKIFVMCGAGEAGFMTIFGFCWIRLKIGSVETMDVVFWALILMGAFGIGVDIA